jgi:hypothetical protein
VSARWAFNCASCECRWAYCRVLLEAEAEAEAEDVVAEGALLVAVGFDVDDDVAAAKAEGLAGGWWSDVEGAIWYASEVGLEDRGSDLQLERRTTGGKVGEKQRFGNLSVQLLIVCSRRGIWRLLKTAPANRLASQERGLAHTYLR